MVKSFILVILPTHETVPKKPSRDNRTRQQRFRLEKIIYRGKKVQGNLLAAGAFFKKY